ncbi:hypothetical protein ACM614_05705 [Streptomyces sp. 12297]
MRTPVGYVLAAAALIAAVAGGTALAGQAREESTASAADNREMLRIADAYLGSRAAAVTRAAARPEVPAGVMTPPLAAAMRGEYDALAARARTLRGDGAGYGRAETDRAAGTAEVAGDTATLDVEELTRLFHETPEPGAPAYEAYLIEHTLTFRRTEGGRWLLSADRPHTGPGDLLPITQLPRP